MSPVVRAAVLGAAGVAGLAITDELWPVSDTLDLPTVSRLVDLDALRNFHLGAALAPVEEELKKQIRLRVLIGVVGGVLLASLLLP